MSLDTYTNLQTEIADWLNRQDLVTRIPTFISLLEAQAQRNLRTLEMVTRAYAQTLVGADGSNSEYLPLPGDYLELKRARVTSTDLPQAPLEYASMGEIDRIQQMRVIGGVPTDYNIVGKALRLGPAPDKQYTIEIVYYASLPKLSASNQRNWLLAAHPDLYLYGSLMQAAPYLKDDDRIGVWQGIVGDPDARNGLWGQIMRANERGEVSGQPIRARLNRSYG